MKKQIESVNSSPYMGVGRFERRGAIGLWAKGFC